MIRILADSKIVLVREAFSSLGEVELFDTPALSRKQLQNTDVLLVRSETKVDADLLSGSSVQFVGTATAGIDHVDTDYLRRRGIGFASAPGSNARSVAEYVVAAILEMAVQERLTLSDLTLGVIGVGNIGSIVVQLGRSLGMKILANDPPLARLRPDDRLLPLEDVLRADIVTLHVPLHRLSPFPTWHLLDQEYLGLLKPGAVIINTSRGPVIDNGALQRVAEEQKLGGLVLDVWEGEPKINLELLRVTDLGTPHVAGYSWDGKVRGTKSLHDACGRHFNLKSSWRIPADTVKLVEAPASESGHHLELEARLLRSVRHSYQIKRDDQLLRLSTLIPEERQGRYFRQLRARYLVRREFSAVAVHTPSRTEAALLAELGFCVLNGS